MAMTLVMVVTAVTVAVTVAVVAVMTVAVTPMFAAVVIVLALVVSIATLFALLLVAVEPSALDHLRGGAILVAMFTMPAFIATALVVLRLLRGFAFRLLLKFTIVLGIVAWL